MKLALRSSQRGWTLTELMMAMTISSVLIAGLLIAAYSLQRGFQASRHHIVAQSQQMRLMDYINLDLRRSLSVETLAGPVIKLTIPDYYELDSNGDLQPRNPEITGSTIKYGPNPVTIQYFQEGDNFIRQEGSAKQVLASDVEDFDFVPLSSGDQYYKVSFTFVPRFQVGGRSGEDARSGTTTYTKTLLRNKRK